jgi:hypothetical protein
LKNKKILHRLILHYEGGEPMKFNLTINLTVDIKDYETTVNEIVRGVKDAMKEASKRVMEEVLRCYQEKIRGEMIRGNMKYPHGECGGDGGFVGRGWRKRRLKTEVGDIEVDLARLECKRCGAVISPFLDVIGVVAWQRLQDGIKERIIELLTDLPYRRTEKQSFEFTGVSVSKSQINRWILEEDWSGIVFEVEMEGIREIYADGTEIKKQDGSKGEMRVMIGRRGDGKVVPIGVWVDKGWEEIRKELVETYGEERFKGKVLLSDGEKGIERLLFEGMEHQRCIWHGSRDLGYVLWKDGVKKEEREKIIEDFRDIINISDRGRKDIEERLNKSEEEMRKLVKTLRENKLESSAVYVERLSKGIFTYVKLLIERGEEIGKTTGPIERAIREIGRRIKRVGGSWTDVGALNLIKLLWKRVFEGDELKKFWEERFCLDGNCKVGLVSMSCTL